MGGSESTHFREKHDFRDVGGLLYDPSFADERDGLNRVSPIVGAG